MTMDWIAPSDGDWSLVRTEGGRTIHVASCAYAKTGKPWRWAAGKTFAEILLTTPWSRWASCCCGWAGTSCLEIKQKLGLLDRPADTSTTDGAS